MKNKKQAKYLNLQFYPIENIKEFYVCKILKQTHRGEEFHPGCYYKSNMGHTFGEGQLVSHGGPGFTTFSRGFIVGVQGEDFREDDRLFIVPKDFAIPIRNLVNEYNQTYRISTYECAGRVVEIDGVQYKLTKI